MRETDLPSPQIGGKGHILRRMVAVAISQMQVSVKNYTNGQHPKAATFSAFLAAAKTAVDAMNLLTPVLTFTPAAKSYSIATGATAGPTLAKGGSTGAATYTSGTPSVATVNAATGAVTGLAGQAGRTTIITVTVAADATYRANTASYVATITA